MPFYVSRFTGTGTHDDPFRPTAGAQAETEGTVWQAIDLRADATQQAGRCMVWTRDLLVTPLPTGVTLIAESPDDTLSLVVRNGINSQLGVTVPADITFRHALRWLLRNEARLDGTRWKPLRAELDGRFRLYLGEHVDDWEE
jgi:hypothetical protein